MNDPKGQPTTLRQALLRDYTINRANRKMMTALAERMPQDEQRNRLMELVDNSDALSEYIDIARLRGHPEGVPRGRFQSPAAFLAQLSPVVPRLYSIASSLQAHPHEAHLCITVVRYETHGRAKKGLASGFFADHSDMFVKNIPVYVQESRTFRLPPDGSTDIIMCGPGVGLAPFRAFLEQRTLDGATGRNWLFFGEQHQATDFLYGNELQEFQRKGKLHRLDLAFSRDQSHKIYVQHRMREQAKRTVVVAAERRLLLRVRRRAPHGEGRAPGADRHCAEGRRAFTRSRRSLRERHADEDGEAVSEGCVLSRYMS